MGECEQRGTGQAGYPGPRTPRSSAGRGGSESLPPTCRALCLLLQMEDLTQGTKQGRLRACAASSRAREKV